MKASEIIDCELREDGLHVTAYRHQGVCCACCVVFEKGKWARSINKVEFADEQSLMRFAEEKILPSLFVEIVHNHTGQDISDIAIIPSICEMSIGEEMPHRMM
jgi:hypothetical protein